MPCDSDVLTFRQQRTESTNVQKSTLSFSTGIRPVERVFICNLAYEVGPGCIFVLLKNRICCFSYTFLYEKQRMFTLIKY